MFQRTSLMAHTEYETENVSSLHARLHMEADKIRKWKIQTELDLKEKDKKLRVTSTQIETMKKSMLELQLDNERLSSKMQEEIDNREEIMGKIMATRDMCSLLKSTAATLENRMLHCETEKTELKYTGKEFAQQLEEVSGKFDNMHLSMEENAKKLLLEVEKERNVLSEKEKLWNSKCEENMALINNYETTLKDRENTVSGLQTALTEKNSTCEILNETMELLKTENKTLKENLTTTEENFKESALRILSIQDEKQNLEEKLQNCFKDLESLQEAHKNMCQEMKDSCFKNEKQIMVDQEKISHLHEKLKDEQEKLKLYQDELQDALTKMENVKSSKDILTLEFTELEIKVDLQNFEIKNLKTDLSEKGAEIYRLSGEMVDLSKKLDSENLCKMQLQDIEKDLQSKVCSLELEKDDLEQAVSDLKNSLKKKEIELCNNVSKEKEQSSYLQAEMISKEKELEIERTKLKNLQNNSNQFCDEIAEKNSCLSAKENEIRRLEKELEDQRCVSENCQKELDCAKASVEELRIRCEEESKEADVLKKQLNDLNLKNKEHEKCLDTQLKKIDALTTKKKNSENELKSLKAEVNMERKKNSEKEKAIKAMGQELETLKLENEDLIKSKLESEHTSECLKAESLQDKKASEEAIAKAKELQQLAKKEKENANALTECQLAEMMGTLDNYKQSSEKMLAEKDVEIKSLKQKLDAAAAENLCKTDRLNDDNKDLSSKIYNLSKEREQLQQQLNETANENHSLKKQIQEMEGNKNHSRSVSSADVSKSSILGFASELHDSQTPLAAPVTPQRQVLRTPNLPKTPLRTHKTPTTSVQLTPQRSILKIPNSVSKRRKVAFMSKEQENIPSSSDELMELEVEIDESNQPIICMTPSSKFKTLKHLTSEVKHKITPKRSSGFADFCKPLNSSTPIKKMPDSMRATRLTPINKKSKDEEPKLKKSEDSKTPNTRNVPVKKTSKFFSTSPKDKARTRIKEKTKSDNGQLSWFDLDSVYGFNPED